MRRSHRLLVVLCVVLVAATLGAGCAKKKPTTTTSIVPSGSSGSVTPTSDVEPGNGAGEKITTPVTGTPARTALMDAARAKLGTSAQFIVYQLYVQGEYAIGDLETSPGGKRQFVAFKGPEWQALWVAPYGDPSATSAKAKAAVPGLSAGLLAKIDWTFKKPVSDAAMESSLSTEAKKWSKTLMEGLGEPYNVVMVKAAKDSTGTWWGRAVVQPSSTADASFEPIDYWCRYSSGTWTGTAQDPEPPAPTSFFPSEVAGPLGF